MKYYESKMSKIFSGKSFYFILALCLVAIGAAAWMAMDKIENENNISEPKGTGDYSSSITESAPESIIDTPADDVGGDASEPYELEEEEPIEIPDSTVATNFIISLNGNIAKSFSEDTLVYSNTYKDMRLHTGVDIVGSLGDEIKSCGNGRVVALIEDAKLGKYVEIEHGNGVVARYCGLDKVSVKEGDTVRAGLVLGTLGTVPEECMDQPHLHLEFYRDEKICDPLKIIYPED